MRQEDKKDEDPLDRVALFLPQKVREKTFLANLETDQRRNQDEQIPNNHPYLKSSLPKIALIIFVQADLP